MDGDRDEAIGARAYQLWEEGGREHGLHDEHWRQAKAELEGGDGRPSPVAPEAVEPPSDVSPETRSDASPETE